MTATGSHIDFRFAARSTTLQGKAFSLSRQALHRFLPLKYRRLAGGACRRPYTEYPTAYRPSSGHPKGWPLSRGMTATGSHIYFYSLRGAQPSRGRLFLCPGGPSVNFYCSDLASWRAGHAAAPTTPRREVSYKRKKFPPMAGIDIWPLQRRAHWHKIASQSNARPK